VGGIQSKPTYNARNNTKTLLIALKDDNRRAVGRYEIRVDDA
jgi:hypothetical protein